MLYTDLKNEQIKPGEHFFAFSDKQFEEGMKRIPEGKKVLRSHYGLFGTREGLDAIYAHEANKRKRIAEQVTAQEVYDYEYRNHECEISWDGDEGALEVVFYYHGADGVRNVKRKRGYPEDVEAMIIEFQK